MKKPNSASDGLALPHTRDEKKLREQAGRFDVLSPQEIEALIHDFNTYQTELELRNEELRRALKETEARRRQYADLYDFSPIGYFVLDSRGLILNVNLAGAALLGKDRGSLAGMQFTSFVSQDDQDTFAAHCRRTREEQPVQTAEIKLNGPENTILIVRLRSAPAHDSGSIMTTLSDITDLKHADEFTRHLASFPQVNPNPVMEVDFAGNVVFANEAAYTILKNLGLKKDDIGCLLPADMGDILKGLQGNSDLSLSREVMVNSRVIGETINLVPQLGVARIYARDITDHRLAQEALRQSEERFRLIAETSADVIFQLDIEGRVTYCSPAVRSYGYSPDTVIGKSFSGFVAQDDLPKAADAFQRVNLGERLNLFEIRVQKADGSTVDVELSATPIANDGTIVGIQGIARNISQRKQVEDALRESEERLRLAQLAAKIGAFEWNVQTGMNVWTPELEAMYGLSPGEFGRTQPAWEQLVHPEDRAAAVALVDRAFETGEPVSGEWRVMWHDGSVHWIHGRFQLFKDEAGRPMRLAGVNIDITERKQVEDALRASLKRYQSYIEVTGQLGWTTNANGEVEEDIPSWRLYTGQTRDETMGWGWSKALHPDDLEHTLQIWRKAVTEKRDYEVEYRIRRHDGVYRHFIARGIPVFAEDGRVLEWVGTCIDITERKQVEDALRESEERFRAVFESSSDCILVWDRQGNYLYANQAAIDHVGTTRDKVLGKNIRDGLGHIPDFMHLWLARLEQAFSTGEPFRVEDSMPVGGRLVHSESQISPIRDASGRVFAVSIVYRDVTERKQVEEALHQSRMDLDRAQDVGQIGWWRLDTRQNVLTWSDQTYRIFGVPKGAPLTYETFLSSVYPGDRAYVDREWKEGLQGKPYDIEHRILVDGKTKWIRGKAYLEFDKNGSLLGGFGITQDITKKKLAEEELRRIKDDLQVIVAEKTAELRDANRILEGEISERIEIENNLKTTNALLKLLSKTFSRKEYLDSLVTLLGDFCGCECVGIRIAAESGDFPYAASEGFSKEFIEQEGRQMVGSDSCACTRIAQGRPEESEASFITPAGSFVCNDSSCLLNTKKNSGSATYRAACAQHGFFSLAVIPVRYRNETKVIIHLADKRPGIFSERIISLIESLTPIIGEALQRFDVEAQLMASREQLRSHSIHLLSAREEERVRVAREIHDELGQTLTAARMELAMLKKGRDKRAAAEQKISLVLELIDNSIEDIQRICSELRPRVLDHLGLKAAIEWQAKKFTELVGLNCFLDLPHAQISLPSSVATSVFRIFQEALTNIARHAKASTVRIRLGIEDAFMLLEIHDDGKGILKHRLSGKDSFGIMGIRERVHQLGGTVTFKGVRNKGTTVTVTIPLNKGVPDV